MKLDIDAIRDEVLAGHLWMRLDVPTDASRGELERHARELIAQIGDDDSQAAVEQRIRVLQVQKLCRPVNLASVSELAKESIAVVRSRRRQAR
jgi:hypothetical protein